MMINPPGGKSSPWRGCLHILSVPLWSHKACRHTVFFLDILSKLTVFVPVQIPGSGILQITPELVSRYSFSPIIEPKYLY